MLWESVELTFLWVSFAMQGGVWSCRMTGRAYVTVLCASWVLEIPQFTLVEEQEVFKNNVRNIYFASPKLQTLIMSKISYVQLYTLFSKLTTHLFHFFIFSPFHGNQGFQAYVAAKHYFAIFWNIWMCIPIQICLKTIYIPLTVRNNFQSSLFI